MNCRDSHIELSEQLTFKSNLKMLRNEVINRDWHRQHIVAAVHVKGFTLRQLSVRAGLKPDSLKNVLYRPCKKYERIIAEALEVSPEEIWPSRYLRKVA